MYVDWVVEREIKKRRERKKRRDSRRSGATSALDPGLGSSLLGTLNF